MEFSERDEFVHGLVYAYCRWKWAIVIAFAVLMIMIFFVGYLVTPTWKAQIFIQVEASRAPTRALFPDPTTAGTATSLDKYAQQVVRILQGEEAALKVVDKFGLAEHVRKKAEEPSNLRQRIFSGVFGAIFGCIESVQSMMGKPPGEETDWRSEAVEDFREGIFAWLSAEMVQETDIIELGINGETAELANEMCVFMVDSLRESLTQTFSEAGERGIDAFQKELERTIERQSEAEDALRAFLEANNGVSPAEDSQSKATDLATLNGKLGRLLAEKAELDRQRSSDREGARLALAELSSDRVMASPGVAQVRAELQELRVALAALLEEVTEEHPDAISLLARQEQTESELIKELDGVIRTIDSEVRSASQEIEGLESELSQLPAKEFEFSRLSVNVETLREMARELRTHIDSLTVSAESGVAPLTIRIIDRDFASPTTSPDNPSWLIVILVAILFAGGTVVVVPPFLEYWRDPIRGPLDLEHHGIATLGVVAQMKMSPPETTTPNGDKS